MTPKEQIFKLLAEKSILKQNIFHNTLDQFNHLKELLVQSCQELKEQFADKDQRVTFEYKDLGSFQCQIKIAGDLLIFQMHSNVFQLEESHSLWKSGYLTQNPNNSYVGVINVYNFLADSFRYDRSSDIGYLIARVFINQENHFIVQGKKQLGFLFNDFISSEFGKEQKQNFLDQIILYTLNFDLFVPPFENLHQITVEEMQDINHRGGMATGKRLGFQFGIHPEE